MCEAGVRGETRRRINKKLRMESINGNGIMEWIDIPTIAILEDERSMGEERVDARDGGYGELNGTALI